MTPSPKKKIGSAAPSFMLRNTNPRDKTPGLESSSIKRHNQQHDPRLVRTLPSGAGAPWRRPLG